MTTRLSPKLMGCYILAITLIGMSIYTLTRIPLPLTPWIAAGYVLLTASPFLLGTYLLLGQRIHSKLPNNSSIALHILCISALCLTTITTAFYYNYSQDHSPTQTHTARVLTISTYNTPPTTYDVAQVTNHNPPLLFFIPPTPLNIPLRASDKNKIKPKITSIQFTLSQGALGMPWAKNYDYEIIHYLDAFLTRLFTKPQKPIPVQHPLSVPYKTLVSACNWVKNFDATKEIEIIPADDFERAFWSNKKPRSIIPLVKGVPHGIEQDFFKDGKNYADIPWKHGKKHGVFALLRPNGTLEQRLSYKDGQQFGINQFFDEHGRNSKQLLYIDDTHVLPVRYCNQSSLISSQESKSPRKDSLAK